MKIHGYEIDGGESFPEIDNPELTKNGEFDEIVEKTGLNPIKEMNQEQRGTYCHECFYVKKHIYKKPSLFALYCSRAVSICTTAKRAGKVKNSIHGWS